MPRFDNVLVRGVHPGIDVVYVYRTTGQRIAYDVIVAPTARLDDVRLAFDGASELTNPDQTTGVKPAAFTVERP